MHTRSIRVGMTLEIKSDGGQATKDTQGWEERMNQYLGTKQKVMEVHDEGTTVVFENNYGYYWNIDDLQQISSIEEVTLPGKKQHFDVNDL